MNSSDPWAAVCEQSASLPGSRSLRTAVLRETSFSCRRPQSLVGPLDDPVEEPAGLLRRAGEPMVEGVLDRVLDDPRRLDGGELVLGLADELGLAHEHRQHRPGGGHHVIRRHLGDALVADQSP